MRMLDMGPAVRVLVIDQRGGMGAAVNAALANIRELRFDTTLVSSAAEAKARTSTHAHDLAIVCLQSCLGAPTPASLEEFRELRRIGLDLPTVVVTPEIDRAARIAAAREGVEQSFSIEELGSSLFALAITYVIGHRRSVERRTRLETLLECCPSHILTVDPGGIIRYINHTLPPLTKDQVVGASWLHFVPEARREATKQMLARVLATGESDMYETETQGFDGGAVFFSCHIGPIRDRDEIVGAVVIAQDVTDRRRVADDLLAAQRMAAVGSLAAGIAHEINTPIQFVSDSLVFLRGASEEMFSVLAKLEGLYLQVAEGRPTETTAAACSRAVEEADLDYVRENVPAAFERCVDGLSRVSTIVRSLKEFAHPSNREMAPIDLNRAIQNTLTIARGEYKYVADVETQFGDLPPVVCHGDEINQVVLNLIVNAAHAIEDVVRGSDHRGRILLRTEAMGGEVLIAVSDTGTGIASDIVPRIFDPFFTTKEVGKGTGQGLAIARTIIKEHHGGDIAVETRVGEGTTFSIRLPIEPPRAEAAVRKSGSHRRYVDAT
jgi:two-component system NtrC family sensor kinase